MSYLIAMCKEKENCHCGCSTSSSLNEELNDIERFIKRVNLGPGLLIKFKGDPKEYVVKNVSADRQTVFVQPEPGRYATFNKKIKNTVAIQRKPVDFDLLSKPISEIDKNKLPTIELTDIKVLDKKEAFGEDTSVLIKALESLTGKKIVLEAEESKKVSRDAFLYMGPKEPKENFAQCSTCIQWTGKTCAIIGSDTEVTGDMSCGLYVHGEPTKELLGKEKKSVTAEEAGLVKRKVQCKNCRSFDTAESTCLLFEALNKLPYFDLDKKVDKNGCCNAQMPKE